MITNGRKSSVVRTAGSIFVTGILILCAALSLLAQGKPQESTIAPAVTQLTAGQETFRAYCASCHGFDGKGNGAATPELKSKPPDLTQLSRANGGKFPSAMVENVIQGNQFVPAHGTRDMPVWGEAFRNANRDESLVKAKVHNLALYMESIQQK